MRARFEATLRAPDMEAFAQATIVSSCDVPRLLIEVERLRRDYADLVAACRAGLLAKIEGDALAWDYVSDALPPAPPGHPLHTHMVERRNRVRRLRGDLADGMWQAAQVDPDQDPGGPGDADV